MHSRASSGGLARVSVLATSGQSKPDRQLDTLKLRDAGFIGAAQTLVGAANKDPSFAGVFTLFGTGAPSIYADIDRERAEKVGLTPTDVFSTLQVYLGSQYVNDFNYLGRTYEVIAQADGSFRRDPQDISRLKARNTAGEMVPVGTVAKFKYENVPYRVPEAADGRGHVPPSAISCTSSSVSGLPK